MAEGYLIGPDLLGNIRKTIDAVDSLGLTNMQPTRIQTRFEEVQYPQQKIFRIGTFTGAWAINASKVVTLPVSGSTVVTTVPATNLFTDLTNSTSTATTMQCGISKEGTAWFLTEWPEQSGGPIKKGTFTGPWNKSATKSVVSGGTTFTVTNIGVPIGIKTQQTCLFTQIGNEYQLVYTDTAQVIRGYFDAPWVKDTTNTVYAEDGEQYTAENPYGTAFRNGNIPENQTDYRQCAIAYIGTRWVVVDAECLA